MFLNSGKHRTGSRSPQTLHPQPSTRGCPPDHVRSAAPDHLCAAVRHPAPPLSAPWAPSPGTLRAAALGLLRAAARFPACHRTGPPTRRRPAPCASRPRQPARPPLGSRACCCQVQQRAAGHGYLRVHPWPSEKLRRLSSSTMFPSPTAAAPGSRLTTCPHLNLPCSYQAPCVVRHRKPATASDLPYQLSSIFRANSHRTMPRP